MAEPQWIQNFREMFQQARALLPKFSIKNIPHANMDLARKHMQLGNLQDAALRYRIVAYIQPQNAEAWTGYGTALMLQGKKPQAKQAFSRALAASPGYPAAVAAMQELHKPPAA